MAYSYVIYINIKYIFCIHPSLLAQRVKRLCAMRETWVRSLGRKDPLEKEMAAHSSALAWRTPWTEEPGGLQSTGSQRAGRDRMAKLFSLHTQTHVAGLFMFSMCKMILASKCPSCCHCMGLVSNVGGFPHLEDCNARLLEYVCVQMLWQVLCHCLNFHQVNKSNLSPLHKQYYQHLELLL